MKIEELENDLKNGVLDSFYLLYGEEKYLLNNCIRNIQNLFGEKVLGINYILLDDNNINSIISDMETPSFGFEKKLIIVKNTGLFNKKNKNEFADLKEKLITYINENIDILKQTVILVFYEEIVEKDKLFDIIDKYGVVCKSEYQKPFQIQARINNIVKMYGVGIDKSALNYFIESCGTDMQELVNEIRKLIEYKGKGNLITIQDIDNLSIKKMESIIFELTDSLGKKNVKQAIEVLRNLILAKEPLQKILITLYNHFKKLYLTKVALKTNKDIILALDLKPNQTFLVNKYKMQASCFKMSELKKILYELYELDYKSKNGLLDLQTGLESILCAYV